jgi:hypothetical protein
MNTNRPITNRVVTVVVTLAATGGLAALGTTAAVAEPPAVIVDPCAELLAQAAVWPGVVAPGTRHFSDAYESYLSRQPACTTGN